MKVYSTKDGSATDHHPVDAREIARERPQEFTLRNPNDPAAQSAPVPSEDPEAQKRAAEEAAARKELAEAAQARAVAVDEAKRRAAKLRDEAEEARRKAGAAHKNAKAAAEQAAADAEKLADDADSEVARLESGGEVSPPAQQVSIK